MTGHGDDESALELKNMMSFFSIMVNKLIYLYIFNKYAKLFRMITIVTLVSQSYETTLERIAVFKTVTEETSQF